jgi:DNA-binding transcriptional LysR family regulator
VAFPVWADLHDETICCLLTAPMSPNSPRHPGLAALETFLAVARLGSFRAAAAARGVTPSALSHAMRSLEAQLGTRLFHRTSRSVRLTDRGERLLARLAPALEEIDEAVAALGDEAGPPAGCASTCRAARFR